MVDMRKEARGERGGECELKIMKGLEMGNSKGIKGKVIISPRRFGGRRDVRGREEDEFMSKVAESSIRLVKGLITEGRVEMVGRCG
jgi:hypothetical protein